MPVANLDLNQVRAILMIALLIGFLGIWAWAWSSKRKPAFRDASMLPLEDDQAITPADGGQQREPGSSPC
jgi:cytochrome c oxidase cbb3-type subunit IV